MSPSPQYPADIDPRDPFGVWVNSAVRISAMVVLYYDYFLTLPREILFLWPPHNKLGWYTSTCLLNRYLPVLGSIPMVISYLIPVDSEFCQGLHVYPLCLIRVYALYGRSRRILTLLLTLGSGVIINACVQTLEGHRTEGKIIPGIPPSSFAGCYQLISAQGGKSLALAWMGVLLFDSVVFTLILYKAFTMGSGIWLLYVIVRDGAMYFSVLFIINLANIFILLYSSPLARSTTVASTNVFVSTMLTVGTIVFAPVLIVAFRLSITLVSRLILNLREQNAALAGLPTTMESMGKFQAGLPVVPHPITSVGDLSSSVVWTINPTGTIGTVECLADPETQMIPVGPGQDNTEIVREVNTQ